MNGSDLPRRRKNGLASALPLTADRYCSDGPKKGPSRLALHCRRYSVVIVECPHCYTHMMPSPQGECPSCRKNIHDAGNADPARTAVSIRHLAELPQNCCDCGRETARYVNVTRRISRKAESHTSDVGALLFIASMFSCLFLPFALLFGLRERTGDSVRIDMPQCEACAAHGPPVPTRVNSEELRMTFVVDRQFKKRIVEQATL